MSFDLYLDSLRNVFCWILRWWWMNCIWFNYMNRFNHGGFINRISFSGSGWMTILRQSSNADRLFVSWFISPCRGWWMWAQYVDTWHASKNAWRWWWFLTLRFLFFSSFPPPPPSPFFASPLGSSFPHFFLFCFLESFLQAILSTKHLNKKTTDIIFEIQTTCKASWQDFV